MMKMFLKVCMSADPLLVRVSANLLIRLTWKVMKVRAHSVAVTCINPTTTAWMG